jgi:hypothetical protein
VVSALPSRGTNTANWSVQRTYHRVNAGSQQCVVEILSKPDFGQGGVIGNLTWQLSYIAGGPATTTSSTTSTMAP